MLAPLRAAAVLYVGLTLLTGVAYPAAVTAAAQGLFPAKANGSLVERNGRVVGSSLLGQSFSSPRYFWGRLSATTPGPYNAAASGGSNFGPTNPAVADAAKARVRELRAADATNLAPVPVDLVTSSASGLDPHVSPAAATYQVGRVAAARGVSPERVAALVAEHTEPKTLGLLGEARVHVLGLNLALDALSADEGRPASAARRE